MDATYNYQAPIYRENHVKMMQERITKVENQFGELCQIFGSLERKLSKMRDTGDKLAKAVAEYSSYERFNASTKSSLKDFSLAYAAIQDFRDVEVKRLDAKVIQPLSNYGELCKKTRESLKKASAALAKEMKQRKSLETAREKNPSNTQQLSHVNMQLEKAAQDSTMRTKQVELEMDQFEKKKLADMKKILIDFVNMEMIFHAKSLEWYTEAHNSLSLINEDEDLEEFRTLMRQSSVGGGSTIGRPPLAQRSQSAGSRTSLNSTGTDTSHAGTNGRGSMTTPTGARRPPSTNSTPRQTPRDDDDEEEENEDEAETGSEEESDDVQDDDDDDDDNSEDDYARQLSSGQQRPASASAASGSRSSQGNQAPPGKSSTSPQNPNTPTKSILRPKPPKY